MNTWRLATGSATCYVMARSMAGAKIFARERRLLPPGIITADIVDTAKVPKTQVIHKAFFRDPVEASREK